MMPGLNVSRGAIALRNGFKDHIDRRGYPNHMSPDSADFFYSLSDRSEALRAQVTKNLKNFRGKALAALHMDVQAFGFMISHSLRRIYECDD